MAKSARNTRHATVPAATRKCPRGTPGLDPINQGSLARCWMREDRADLDLTSADCRAREGPSP